MGGGVGLGGQSGCERRIEVFVKIQKKDSFFWGGSVGGSVGGSGWGVRVDVNEELKFCENSKKKDFFFFGGGGGGVVRGGVGGGSGWGVRVDVNEELKFL